MWVVDFHFDTKSWLGGVCLASVCLALYMLPRTSLIKQILLWRFRFKHLSQVESDDRWHQSRNWFLAGSLVLSIMIAMPSILWHAGVIRRATDVAEEREAQRLAALGFARYELIEKDGVILGMQAVRVDGTIIPGETIKIEYGPGQHDLRATRESQQKAGD